MIQLKDASVSVHNTHPALWRAIATAADVWATWNADLILTSVNDGVHPGGARPSFHPKGRAADLRIWNLPINARKQAVEELRHRLGPDFDVLLEADHCHIQYDPKEG